MNKPKMKPDFGVYYLKNFGHKTIFNSVDYTIYEIWHIGKDFYSSTNDFIFDETEYCMTVDFNTERLNEIISSIRNPAVKTYLEKTLLDEYSKPAKADLRGCPIEVMLEAELGAPITNENETYIPFIAKKFTNLLRNILDKQWCIPDRITHVMMSEDMPVGFAIEYSGEDDDDAEGGDGGGGGNGKGNDGGPDEDEDYVFEDDEKDPNLLEAYVCYAEMPLGCEWGSVYLYPNLEKAKKSFAWQVMGGFNYAVPIHDLVNAQVVLANSLWKKYEANFRKGFGNRGITFPMREKKS